MKKNFAYETYKKVEAPSNYATKRARDRYIAALEKRTQDAEMPFLRKHLPKRMESVLEVGSGSGRILHALLEEGRAETAVGLEISPSRVKFGRAWAKEKGLKVKHLVGDILANAPQGTYDAVLCVTSIYPFFDMLKPRGLRHMLAATRSLVRPGGLLMLESVTFASEIAQCRLGGGSVQVWEEYAKDDPFRYNLVRYEWKEKARHLRAISHNVMRHRLRVDGPTVKEWHMQTADSLRELLEDEGYKDIRFFGDFDSSKYVEGTSKRCIVLATV